MLLLIHIPSIKKSILPYWLPFFSCRINVENNDSSHELIPARASSVFIILVNDAGINLLKIGNVFYPSIMRKPAIGAVKMTFPIPSYFKLSSISIKNINIILVLLSSIPILTLRSLKGATYETPCSAG
jgi:hypothetical protein